MTTDFIETAIRYALRDDDGRLYAPVSSESGRPLVYVPGHGVLAAGEEVHLVSVYVRAAAVTVEILAGNGYTLDDGRLVDMVESAINGEAR